MKKSLTIVCIATLLAACNSNKKEYDATGTFEATETTVSAEQSGTLLNFALEEGDDVADEFFLGLDACELVQFVLTDEDTILNICALNDRLLEAFPLELLDELSGSGGNLRVHNGGVADEGLAKRLHILVVASVQNVGEQGVLDHVEYDTSVEAFATKLACLPSIQSCDIRDVEIGILLELC